MFVFYVFYCNLKEKNHRGNISSVSMLAHFYKMPNPGGPARQRRHNVVLGLHIFRNLTEKNEHGSSKHVKI